MKLKRYLSLFVLGSLAASPCLHGFQNTGVEEIDSTRQSVLETPTHAGNAIHRQSVLFSWIRHMINRGVDLQSLHEEGYVLAKWGPVHPENYPVLDKAYGKMEALQDEPVFIQEIRGPESAPFSNPTGWPVFGGSQMQSGLSPDPGPMTGEIAWKFPNGHSWYASPSVENGRVYITSPGMRSLLYCLDEATGDVTWKTTQDGLQMYSTPRGASNVLVLNDRIVMRATSGSWEFTDPVRHIFQIDKESGKVLNQVDAGRIDYRRGTTSVTGNEQYIVYPSGRLDLKKKPPTTILQDTVVVKRNNGQRWWEFRVGQLFGELVLHEELIFAGTNKGLLYALNLEGGNRIHWVFNAGSPIRTTPAVDANTVVTTTESGFLVALDRSSGTEIWRTQLNEGNARAFQLFSSPVIHNGKVFIGSATNELYCVDLATGQLLWKATSDDWIRSKPLVLENRLYFATLSGNVTALAFDKNGFEKLWSKGTGHHQLFADLAGNENGILASSSELYLYSLNPLTGDIQWKQSLIECSYENGERILADIVAGGGDFQSPPTVADGIVYIGSPSRFVFAMDSLTGEEIWRFETSGQVSGAPGVQNGRVYFGQQGGNREMYCVDAKTGDPVWSSKVGWVWTSCMPDGAKVFTGTVEGDIIALEPDTGKRLWTHQTNGGIYPAPAVDDKRVYTGSWDGSYYALNKETGLLDWAYSSFGGLPDSAAGVLWQGMFICRTNRELCGLDKNTAKKLWGFSDPRKHLGNTVMNATPSNSGNRTFVSTSIDHDGAALGATLYCIDNSTGEELWHYTGAGGWTGSSCTENTVICGSSTERFVTCLDVAGNPDGTPRIIWRTRIGGILEETIPAISGDMAYLLCTDGYLYAFR
ncbi:PQQ-binding-like beta-propeller repeat protein [Puniceicoccales bacterium CK1056]|uniref:PQQ-binding-like beta-propeller repeat protein n=1 Tax=Oceanipulchritudo coccoides TaxID=2706888 RepID=A0A6B2LZR9_9BACT|nr:PQQ-binding-like beta-propeller repeat protein [Oceanipulchritudo coccoides]NDV61566.1 PQQ-binding-like beta-propeller repeat protein [Oceanipulchritudo coccoides]